MEYMLTWRTRRQFAAIAILVIFIGAMIFAVIFRALPEKTCFDNRRNQGEEGVDCGGPCVSCALKNPKPLTVFWTKAIAAGNHVYDVAAQIENPNIEVAPVKIIYDIVLADRFGEIARKRGETFMYAKDSMYFVDSIVAEAEKDRRPRRVEFEIQETAWDLLAKAERPNIFSERSEYGVEELEAGRQSVITASVLNRSPLAFRVADVRFLAFDSEDNLLGANRIIVENFLPGTRRSVRSVWPKEFPVSPERIAVEVRANSFDRANLLEP